MHSVTKYIANVICVTIIVLVMLFSPMLEVATNAQSTSQNSSTTSKDYKYNVTIQFGYMSFLYDWGVWDGNTFSYKANESSAHPGAGTEKGKPGWYNFDGINNKISISCTHTALGNVIYPFTIGFEDAYILNPDGTESTTPAYKNITMECYEIAESGNKDWEIITKDPQGAQLTIPLKRLVRTKSSNKSEYKLNVTSEGNIAKKDIYISFYGEPQNNDSTSSDFHSSLVQKIGYLTLTIGKPEILP